MRKLGAMPWVLVSAAGVWALSAVGCAGGEDNLPSGFSGYSASNPTNPTMPASGSSEASEAGSDSGSSTNPVDPSTSTTTPDVTSEPATTTSTTTDPSTTSTTTDPSTTSTTTDPSTTSTTSTSTTDPPPPKDPQPANGVFSDCFQKMCDFTMVDLCLELQDQNMMKLDGFCSLLCTGPNDCQPVPQAPATPQCLDIGGGDKACFLACNGVADCPTGMSCQAVTLPNNAQGKYCW